MTLLLLVILCFLYRRLVDCSYVKDIYTYCDINKLLSHTITMVIGWFFLYGVITRGVQWVGRSGPHFEPLSGPFLEWQ